MIRCDDGQNRYIGWISCKSGVHSFSVCTALDHNFPMKESVSVETLRVDNDLHEIIGPLIRQSWFIERIGKRRDVTALASTLQDIVAELESRAKPRKSRNHITVARDNELPLQLMRHIEAIGWERIVKVDDDMTRLTILSNDLSQREHLFDVVINTGYSVVRPSVHASLPIKTETPLDANGVPSVPSTGTGTLAGGGAASDLVSIVSALDRQIAQLTPFFNEVSDLNDNTWVLEPSPLSFAVTTWRVAIERSCSVVLEINPLSPRDVCKLQFFGPPDRVNHFRICASRNMRSWSKEHSLKENIEMLLELTLPSKESVSGSGSGHQEQEELFEDCGICYTYAISTVDDDTGGAYADPTSSTTGAGAIASTVTGTATAGSGSGQSVPDQVCPNPKCRKMYHFSCLVDWLQSLPTCKTSFNTIFGTCPYCQEPLSARLPK